MVSFTQVVIAVAATALTGANAFTNPCRYPYDNCGWVLASSTYGYTYAELQAAANTTDGSKIYDALYSCGPNGQITYSQWCLGAGKCETGIVPNDNCHA